MLHQTTSPFDLYDLTKSLQLDEARAIQYDLVKLFDAMLYSAEFPDGFRAAVDLRGFNMGRGRQPQSEEQVTDLAHLSKTLQCMLATHGFTGEPVGGCPVGESPSVDEGEVSRIVQSVLSELKQQGMA